MAQKPVAKAPTELTERIYAVARRVPPGFVATYQGIARAAGNPLWARRVGSAMKNSPPDVP